MRANRIGMSRHAGGDGSALLQRRVAAGPFLGEVNSEPKTRIEKQIPRKIMSFFERLKEAAAAEWRAYTEHPFTNGLADGSLAEAAVEFAIRESARI